MTGTKSLQTKGCAGRAPDGEGTVADRKPTGGGGAGNPNSLANLRPGAGAWKPGAAPHLKHGLRTRRPARIIFDGAFEELIDALADTVPLRDENGAVLPQFMPAVELATVKLISIRRALGYLATHGYEDEHGRLRPEVEGVNRMAEALMRDLDRLGATPTSYAKLGFDAVRTEREREDLALKWARQTEQEDADG